MNLVVRPSLVCNRPLTPDHCGVISAITGRGAPLHCCSEAGCRVGADCDSLVLSAPCVGCTAWETRHTMYFSPEMNNRKQHFTVNLLKS